MDRRSFLRAAVVGTSAAALGFSVTRQAIAYPAQTGPSPYGPLRTADANGIQLPAGFTSRVIARSLRTVPGTGHVWHSAPDGGACFSDGDGWIYVSNSEIPLLGGVGAVKFDGNARIVDAYPILSGTSLNCAGGATPWNTWLSCEEHDLGYTWETDPWGGKAPVRRRAMGRFKHEAAACDPVRKVVYQTEDTSDGCFYRFVPTVWPDLSAGTLQVLVDSAGSLSWMDVPDPDGVPTPTMKQVSGAKLFNGGEGAYYTNDKCFFTTKGDNKVWAYDAAANTLSTVYDDDSTSNPPLTGVDNITGDTHVGDLYVAEDGGNMEICVITPDDIVAPFLRVTGQSDSELCGVAFNPAGDRLYFSSQRGTWGLPIGGITYEITGPFRTSR
ncbi:alkaline phosphatase PhoX [Qaidamihabitans albus]|uniref:alkaline phosphatase PhoX n=1 Tax=Qaidamihabitans albus TaxID=2795733 RepID=UPI0018F1A4CE|nr:alkaline phosphatase PhoX [Qaidamihabitans albus]